MERNITERIPTVNERLFRRERKLNETERNGIGNVFLTPTVYCIVYITSCIYIICVVFAVIPQYSGSKTKGL